MSLITKYYRLFEIRILHEYFLLADEQLSYYDLPLAVRKEQLEKRLLYGHYKLMNDLIIEPDELTVKKLRNYRLKFIQTATGLTVACGSKIKSIGGVDVPFPEIEFSPDLGLNFIIKAKSPAFKNYSSIPFAERQMGGYLFTNSPENVEKNNVVTLSRPAPVFSSGEKYFSGSITDHGGQLKEAIANTTGANHWEDIEGFGYVTEDDRRWLGKVFRYYPSASDAEHPINIILKDKKDEQEVKNITIAKPSVNGVKVDLRMNRPDGATQEIPIPDGIYFLEIKTDSEDRKVKVFLSSEYASGCLGLISMRVGESDEKFRIIGTDGRLLTPHPVFEIRFRSRRTFWRYQAKNVSKKLEPVGTAHFFHDETNNNAQNAVPTNQLITRIPQKMAMLPIQIIDNTGLKESFPQPSPSPMKIKKDGELTPGEPPGRIFSDLYISHIDGKLNVVN